MRSPVEVAVRPMRVEDRNALAEMLRRCSSTSLYHRFHGVINGSIYVEQQLRIEPDIVRIAWAGKACVGFGVLAENRGRPWELGVLVEDAWQRRTIGTRLLFSLISEARHRQMHVVEATVLGEDAFIIGLLRRVGPVRSQIDWGAYTVEVSLATGRQGTRRQ